MEDELRSRKFDRTVGLLTMERGAGMYLPAREDDALVRIVRLAGTYTALTLLSGISLLAAWNVFEEPLPDFQRADRRQLQHWLASRDLEHASPDTQRQVLHRFEQELRQGNLLADGSLDWHHREQLDSNLQLLVRTWIADQAAAWNSSPPARRDAFLDERIDEVMSWLRNASGRQKVSFRNTLFSWNGSHHLMGVLGWLDQRIDEAPQNEREQLREFRTALQQRIVQRLTAS